MKRVLPIVIVLVFSVGYAHVQTVDPTLRADWNRTLHYARQDVDSGNYFAADKLLDEFIRVHPDTREAREIAFWKAAYLLDPGNPMGSLAAGITGLDGYLSANPDGWYRNEATLLRRTASVALGVAKASRFVGAAVDSTGAPIVRDTTVVKDTVVVASKSRDEQIAALKDQLAQSKAELAKVSAELDRIKKRLANPSN